MSGTLKTKLCVDVFVVMGDVIHHDEHTAIYHVTGNTCIIVTNFFIHINSICSRRRIFIM